MWKILFWKITKISIDNYNYTLYIIFMKNDDHKNMVLPITVTRIMRRAMQEYSKKLPGCPRPMAGSASWFARVAIIEKLKHYGLELKKLDEKYQ
jgi:hypothetical protein